MTTADAADRLGVSQRQVQRLIASGDLPATRTAGDAWVVDALSLNALVRSRPGRGRPWSLDTAWAALWHLSGLDADWLDQRTTSRLTERLVSITAEELLRATRRRAVVHRYRASGSLLADLDASVARTGTSAMTATTFGMGPDSARVDGYCDDWELAALVHDHHLVDDARGNVTLRVAPLRRLRLGDGVDMPLAVVAVDLAESLEVRERSAGLRVLRSLLP